MVWSLWLAVLSRGSANPSCLSQLDDFMKQWLGAIRFRSYASEALAKVPTMILCETRGLQLFVVIREGIGLTRRLGAELQHTERLMSESILSPEPEHQEPIGHHRGMKTWEITWIP